MYDDEVNVSHYKTAYLFSLQKSDLTTESL